MPLHEPELPRGLAIRSSDAPTFGVPASRVRRRDVSHPFHGVSGIQLDTGTVLGRCLAFEPLLLSGQFFSHATAAALLGAPVPESLATSSLDVAVLFPRTPPRGRGIAGRRVAEIEVTMQHGFPIASAPDVFCQLGSVLTGPDLVAIGDHFLTGARVHGIRGPALCRLDDLRAAGLRHRAKPGARTVAWALDRTRSGADSRPETLLRLLLVAGGFAEPELDVEIEVSGGIRLHPDLAFVHERIALEYEGDLHRLNAAVWRRDIERRELMEAAGWRVIRVTALDLFEEPERFLARVRQIVSRRSG